MTKAVLGIIGGSGIYDLPGLEDVREQHVATPWGETSDVLRIGYIGGTQVVFLPRHGRGHRLPPSEINYRANIDALKRSGVTDLVSFSACGSYKEELSPGTFVLVDNFVDRTVRRESSFFGSGCVAHVSFAHPVGPALQDRLPGRPRAKAFRSGAAERRYAWRAAILALAESPTYLGQGYDVVRMTSMPEAKLARGRNHLRRRGNGHRLRLLARDAQCRRRRQPVGHGREREKARRLFARLAAISHRARPCQSVRPALRRHPHSSRAAIRLVAKLSAVAGPRAGGKREQVHARPRQPIERFRR
jgi:5'-methylthioadenosine phosphorylase